LRPETSNPKWHEIQYLAFAALSLQRAAPMPKATLERHDSRRICDAASGLSLLSAADFS